MSAPRSTIAGTPCFGLPGIEDDGRQEVDEEEVLAEDEDVRALPLGRQQDHHAGAQPLSQPKKKTSTISTGVRALRPAGPAYQHQGGSFAWMQACAYDDERGDGLVDPPVLLEEVAEDDAGAEQRHEQVDGHHRRVVGGGAQHAQAHQVRHQAEPHAAPPAIRQRLTGRRMNSPAAAAEKMRSLAPAELGL